MSSPFSGQAVAYYPNGMPGVGEQPLAATVTYVHNERLVNLVTFTVNGEAEARTSVPFLQDGDPPLANGAYATRF